VQHAIPIVLGGNGAPALDRVARYGDGWYGFNLTLDEDEVPERLEMLGAACQRHGRVATSVRTAAFVSDATPSDLPDLVALGLTELVLVESPPSAPDDASAWVDELARRWGLETRATP
jgi:alkanesulfonate monooxygenase SsuD/methylene tetrahydromethanopterin reductase-like flavin-dependent oxidoreductase (luciferase family)